MKHFALILAVLMGLSSCFAQNQKTGRPPITGIGSVSVDVSDPSQGIVFYINHLGFGGGMSVCEGAGQLCLGVNGHQRIELLARTKPTNNNFIEEITFETTDAELLHRYLTSSGHSPGEIKEIPKANRRFSLTDPDGHRIGFIQYLTRDNYSHPENQASKQIIHAGFVVHDRAAEDRFYKDILGFHVYWHGGMKDDETNWVDMQVPDGTDWIEYMLNVPANADHHTLGVMNHIALGVPDIKAAREQLIKNGWKPGEEPKIGRDGKWQLNLYDPDDTRVEFMEFTPTQKPCCSEYTGPHPGQKP